jgi:integral membrane protein
MSRKERLLRIFRIIGALEGISFLVLLGVAMPLKYVAGQPEAVSVVGALHGLLFALYLAATAYVAFSIRWPLFRVLGAVLAAFLPFGPFVFDYRLKKSS